MEIKNKIWNVFIEPQTRVGFKSWVWLIAILFIFDLNVDSKECLWAFTYGFKRFSGLQSSLGITNGNRSHNKPLELIWTI